MKNTTGDLHPELYAFVSLLDAQAPEIQEASQFLLATTKKTLRALVTS